MDDQREKIKNLFFSDFNKFRKSYEAPQTQDVRVFVNDIIKNNIKCNENTDCLYKKIKLSGFKLLNPDDIKLFNVIKSIECNSLKLVSQIKCIKLKEKLGIKIFTEIQKFNKKITDLFNSSENAFSDEFYNLLLYLFRNDIYLFNELINKIKAEKVDHAEILDKLSNKINCMDNQECIEKKRLSGIRNEKVTENEKIQRIVGFSSDSLKRKQKNLISNILNKFTKEKEDYDIINDKNQWVPMLENGYYNENNEWVPFIDDEGNRTNVFNKKLLNKYYDRMSVSAKRPSIIKRIKSYFRLGKRKQPHKKRNKGRRSLKKRP